jgi:hypothetical protein
MRNGKPPISAAASSGREIREMQSRTSNGAKHRPRANGHDRHAAVPSLVLARHRSAMPFGAYACPRCHRVVDQLFKVAISNVVTLVETAACPRCIGHLRRDALTVVEILEERA